VDQPGYQPSPGEEELTGALQRQLVFFRTAESAGTIVIFTSQRFLYVVQFLKEGREYVLENVGGLIFVESGTKRNRIDQTLITPNQFFPRELIAASAG